MPARLATACEELVDARDTVMNIERGVVDVGNVGYGMSYCHTVRDAIDAHRDRDALRLVAVGCSGSKHDVAGAVPAKDLYRRSYWTCKRVRRDDRRRVADHLRRARRPRPQRADRALRAHAGRPRGRPGRLQRAPADRRARDDAARSVGVPRVRRDHRVGFRLSVSGVDPRDIELEILLGRSYRDPLEERGVFDRLRSRGDLSIWFPFQEVEQAAGGNGNQMGWMTDEVAAATTVATDGGTDGGE